MISLDLTLEKLLLEFCTRQLFFQLAVLSDEQLLLAVDLLDGDTVCGSQRINLLVQFLDLDLLGLQLHASLFIISVLVVL